MYTDAKLLIVVIILYMLYFSVFGGFSYTVESILEAIISAYPNILE